MKVIWKYEIPLESRFKIDLPKNARILSVQSQNGNPCMWVEFEPPEINKPSEVRIFFLAATGEAFNETDLEYIETFQCRNGALVFHLYENKSLSF